MTHGVIYNATGAKYVVEAQTSAASLRATHPKLSIALFTDQPLSVDGFDLVLPLAAKGNPFCNRIEAMRNSPFDKSLFLDSDTFICGSILDMFPLLDRFDLAFAAAPTRLKESDLAVLGEQMRKIPPTFPQPNAGLLLFRRSPEIDQLWDVWESLFQRDLTIAKAADYYEARFQGVNDQPALREALYDSSLRWTVLPPEYNCILSIPGQLHGPVRILHGRHPNLPWIAALLNQDLDRRVYAMDRLSNLTVVSICGQTRRTPTLSVRTRWRQRISRLRQRLTRWWRV